MTTTKKTTDAKSMEECFGTEAVKDFCLLNAFKYLWRCKEKHYEIVKTFSDGSELRRYTFYDGSAHSAIFADGCIKEAVPIEKEYDLVAWWETEIELLRR